ncbi:Centriolar coiled-coil protein of 110 kDa [Papilio machaon]|uniref:Centriolar coiled-coil protein of 110 kDa n=1 Tax=Papilio machaon TaxID=76193 RepID=A0A194RC89_PAPMA|nr:Centriolar coiled-coil protein of 110 kDa [Papilio machaon]
MNDPWDVKSVRLSGQYLSCMKINGVPLLPPVLSKECRKEMQYYKLLAKEVEKRILLLKTFTSCSDSKTSEDKTDAPEIPESEQNYEVPVEIASVDTEKILNSETEKTSNRSITNSPKLSSLSSNNSDKLCSNLTPITDTTLNESSKLVIDVSLSFSQTDETTLHGNKTLPQDTPSDLPEHDVEKPRKEDKPNFKLECDKVKQPSNKSNFGINNKSATIDNFLPSMHCDGPSSLGAKSFTGSLNDIHKGSEKTTQSNPLIRQRSYTVLTPSPMLLAHLQIQSLSTGVEMAAISMSESRSNLTSPNKKRKSWDLETAKATWSNMALELKKNNIVINVALDGNNDIKCNGTKKRLLSRSADKSKGQTVLRSRSAATEKTRYSNVNSKPLIQSEPIHKNHKSRNVTKNINDKTHDVSHQKSKEPKLQSPQLGPETDDPDPAKRVRELYERIQKQQLIQMATLVEKQKKEQILLQQVFEEQNNLLFNQLKTICPKSPGEVKKAWIDKNETPERGPVSLSQLITPKAAEASDRDSPVSSTLTDTNHYLNHCDNVLKKSRDITSTIKKQYKESKSESNSKTSPAKSDVEKIRNHSPNNRNTSRKLIYDTSVSSDREYDLILTDRTNDTMADLNVTFPSDNSEGIRPASYVGLENIHGEERTDHDRLLTTKEEPRDTDRAIKSVEDSIKNSILDVRARLLKKDVFRTPTPQERAAATKIVAYAKGYLVRRLLRTERVRATVQTIRDALLCALQLHQERAGIRGPDVDLHRRLIQQITAACYSLHETFITSTAAERCALLAADRARQRALALRASPRHYRPTDIMSQSHSGSFGSRARRPSPGAAMSHSSHGNPNK